MVVLGGDETVASEDDVSWLDNAGSFWDLELVDVEVDGVAREVAATVAEETHAARLVATRNAVDMSPGVVVVSKVEKSVSRQLCSGRGAGPASRTSCSASRAVAAVCAGLQSPSHEDASRSPGLDLPFDDSSSATGAVLCLGTRYGEGVASGSARACARRELRPATRGWGRSAVRALHGPSMMSAAQPSVGCRAAISSARLFSDSLKVSWWRWTEPPINASNAGASKPRRSSTCVKRTLFSATGSMENSR